MISVPSSSSYKTRRIRIVEPHDYGIRRGAEALLGFQIGGESQSGALHGWRHFDVDQIRHLDSCLAISATARTKQSVMNGVRRFWDSFAIASNLPRSINWPKQIYTSASCCRKNPDGWSRRNTKSAPAWDSI